MASGHPRNPKVTFAEVRLPASALVLAPVTAQFPDLRVDAYVDLGVEPSGSAVAATAILAGKGAAMDAAVGRLVEAYGIQPRVQDAKPGRRVLAFDIRHSRLRQTLLGAVLAVQVAHGPAWLHIGHATAFLRCPGGDAPQEVVDRLSHILRLANAPVQVLLVEATAPDLAIWQQLVAAAGDADGGSGSAGPGA